MTGYDEEVKRVVPSVFNMISSSADHQESEETYNTGNFELPNPAGKGGGACTSAFLQQQYEGGKALSWVETLQQMRSVLQGMGFDQTPTLSSSRLIDTAATPMQIVPPGSGRRRALLIGINYVGQKGELTACHNDCNNVREYLVNVHGFREEEMMVLMDDGRHQMPTKKNIEDGMILLTKYSQPGDVVFVSFSGHGGNTEDLDGDEDDGMDETLIPVDFMQEGQIVDDDILKILVKPMRAGVTATVLMDCCHSGTVLDLPYKFAATDKEMTREDGFNMEIVDEAVRPEKPDENAMREAKKKRQKEARKKEKEAEKRAERAANNQPEIVVGPKLAPDGQPVLPTRPAAGATSPGSTGEKDDGQRDEQAPPAPPGCVCVIQ